MAQIIIDTGAAANDGTGDPLRTAFTDTNLNFTAIWNQGPVNSNVKIANNTILTLNTNGNLVLAPNGTGKVVANVDIVPDTANIRNLGSTAKRWSTLYTQYLDVSASTAFSGNLTVGGNLTVSGNIIEMGNIVTDALTIQLANTAANTGSANGAGVTVGANDNIATLLYNSTGNVWTTNIGISAVGNITAPYFIGNGSQLTGLPDSYGNANVATFLANFGSNTISTTGNVTVGNILPAGYVSATGNVRGANLNTVGAVSATGNVAGNYFIGDGSQLTSLPAPTVTQDITSNGAMSIMLYDGNIKYNNYATVEPSSGNITGGNISTTGNVTGNYFIGDGSQLTGISSTGNLEISGTLIEIAAGAPETLINISPSGPTGGWAFLQLPTNDTANTANTRLWNGAGNVEIGTGDFSTGSTDYVWYFDNTGNLNLPSNGDLNFNGGSIAQTLNEDIYIRASDDESDGWSVYTVVDDGAGNILSQTRLEFDQYTVRTDAQGASYTWAFRDSGVLELPGDLYGNVGGNLTIKIGDQAGSDTFIDLQTRSYVGDALISNIRIANPNVTVSTASGVYNWNFDNTGNLTLPLSGSIIGATANNNGFVNWLGNSSGDLNGYTTMNLVPDDTLVNNDQYLVLDPTAPGHIHIRAGGTQDNSSADLFLGGENSYFRVASGANSAASVSANSYVWTYGTDGTFSLPAAESPGQYSEITSVGNSSGDGNGYATLQLKPDASIAGDSYLIIDPTAPNHIHIRAGGAQDNSGAQLFLGGENSYFLVENGANSNVYVASNSNQWKFDTTGVLTLPGEGVLQSLNDTVTLSSLNTTTGNANSVYLGSSGGLGFNDQAIGGNWLEIFRSGSDPEIRVPPGGGNILITGASGSNGASGRDITITGGPADQTNYYTTAGGAVNITGGLGATNDGGGGGPGGNVNITAGVSADPAGHAGNINITAGTSDWAFDYTGGLALATVSNESAKFVGTRKVIGGLTATSPYSVTLSAGGTPTVAYTSLSGTQSVKVCFAVASNGAGFQWEQFDVVAVPSQDVGGAVNFVVSNRVKAAASIPDTVVTATMSGGQIQISLTLDATQTSGGTATFDAVEFGLMVD